MPKVKLLNHTVISNHLCARDAVFPSRDERCKDLSMWSGTGLICQAKKKLSHIVCDYSVLGINLLTLSVLRTWKVVSLFTQGVTRASVVLWRLETGQVCRIFTERHQRLGVLSDIGKLYYIFSSIIK